MIDVQSSSDKPSAAASTITARTVVIGSGPAGIAAAWALVRQGVAVTLVDVGERIEPERETLLEAMYAAGAPERAAASGTPWAPEQVREMKGEVVASAKGIPLKKAYGSDFPHRDRGQGGLQTSGTGEVLTTGALGGFSNIWGAQLMPFMARDMTDWCVPTSEMDPHYRAVLDFVPISARQDDLAEYLPLYKDDPDCLRPSRQGQALLDHMDAHRDDLRREGIVHGASRVAVQVKPNTENPRGCVYCGLCMHGCPYKLIYNSAYTLDILRRDPHFRYLPGILVQKLVETETGVTLHARTVADDAPLTIEAERVYVGTGAVATARLLLESLDAYDTEIVIRDSVQVLVPLLLQKSAPDVMRESLHTLGQANALVFDEKITPRPMHLQIYTFNDHLVATMQGMLKGLYPIASPFLRALLYGRLGVAFAYLHSDDCPSLACKLTRDAGGQSRLVVEGRHQARTQPIIDQLAAKLWRLRSKLGVIPILPQVKASLPGKSYHLGASFPMRANPSGRFESDRWGRPNGWKRIHVVDGTVLPNIAATTFTFTVMANAHRIASAHKTFAAEQETETTMAIPEQAQTATVPAAATTDGAKPRCGITGARGYMGSRITKYFGSHGWTPVEMSRGVKAATPTAIPFSLTSPVALESLKGLDALIHCAWDMEARSRDDIWQNNVEGSKRLLRVAKEAGVPTIIFISTVSAYDGCESLYGKAKLEVEKEALALGAYVVRPGLTYGKGAGGMVGKLAGALKLPVVPLIGSGDALQCLTHEEDLCRLLLHLCDTHPEGITGPITAASSDIRSFRAILTQIGQAQGKKPAFLPIPWQAVHGLLRLMERMGRKPGFKSDSVLGLVKYNPKLDFSQTERIGLPFRPFDPESL